MAANTLKETPNRCEADIMLLLRKRFIESAGNGPAWAFIEHVRDAAGFDAQRTIDAIAMSLWPSRGLEVHGIEIKCSRPDWRNELKDPSKAEAISKYVDRFWIIAENKNIVKEGELPSGWGLMIAQKNRIVVSVAAPKLEPRPISRTFLAALLRQAGREAEASPPEIAGAERQGYERGLTQCRFERKLDIDRYKHRVETLEKREKDFLEVLGSDLGTLTSQMRGMTYDNTRNLALNIKAALDGNRDLVHLQRRIKRIGDDARTLSEQADRILKEHGE